MPVRRLGSWRVTLACPVAPVGQVRSSRYSHFRRVTQARPVTCYPPFSCQELLILSLVLTRNVRTQLTGIKSVKGQKEIFLFSGPWDQSSTFLRMSSEEYHASRVLKLKVPAQTSAVGRLNLEIICPVISVLVERKIGKLLLWSQRYFVTPLRSPGNESGSG